MANYFHPTSKIADFVSIEVSTRGSNTYLGENCVVDSFVKIKHVGGSGHVKIGDGVYVNSGTVIYSGNGVEIGNDVLIGPNCSIVPVNHKTTDLTKPIRTQGFAPSKGGIKIKNNVWLGANVTILDGVVINEGVIVGANSLVTGELEADHVYAGSPAKKIRKR